MLTDRLLNASNQHQQISLRLSIRFRVIAVLTAMPCLLIILYLQNLDRIDEIRLKDSRFDSIFKSSLTRSLYHRQLSQHRSSGNSINEIRQSDLYNTNLNSHDLSDREIKFRTGKSLSQGAPLTGNFSSANDATDFTGLYQPMKRFIHVSFQGLQLDQMNFSQSIFDHASFNGAIARDADFSSAYLHSVDFQEVTLTSCLFIKADLSKTNFHRASLTNSVFRSARLINANFSLALLINVDFNDADLTHAIISDEQFNSVFSLAGARLPNGTIGRNRNLIEYGAPSHWSVEGEIKLTMDPLNHRYKYHAQRSNTTMQQIINIDHYRNMMQLYPRYLYIELGGIPAHAQLSVYMTVRFVNYSSMNRHHLSSELGSVQKSMDDSFFF